MEKWQCQGASRRGNGIASAASHTGQCVFRFCIMLEMMIKVWNMDCWIVSYGWVKPPTRSFLAGSGLRLFVRIIDVIGLCARFRCPLGTSGKTGWTSSERASSECDRLDVSKAYAEVLPLRMEAMCFRVFFSERETAGTWYAQENQLMYIYMSTPL